ncbi:MAG: carboxynorspermidine decarboxylase [Lachnospiraceae bacterium]|nr:carboxynorspermidine decarboxylase [Lachnospiraceae bacterium]
MKFVESGHPAFGRVTEEKWKILCQLPTPCYVLDEEALRANGEVLLQVQEESECKILLAQKAFSNFDVYPLLFAYLAGTEASGLYEARLGKTYMPDGECHVFCGAYREGEFEELLKYADHIVFNSPAQLRRFGKRAKEAGKSVGIRINPECSTQEGHEIYDPCAPGGRLGTTRAAWEEQMNPELVGLLDGLHFHTLCEQNADALEITLQAVEDKFGDALKNVKWLNMGGGHHITRGDYDRELLVRCIRRIREKYDIEVYLEPGEAVALNAGYLVSEVLDVTRNGAVTNVILDMSAACHTPDVIEMPYRPPVMHGMEAGEKAYTYRFGGPTCLSGDVVGDYCFAEPLKEGDKVLFGDMAIYTTCKNNTFNGMKLPDIYLLKKDGSAECLARFGYEDFACRLGGRKPL